MFLTQHFFSPANFFKHKFFSGPKHFWTHKFFFDPQFFLYQILLGKTFFGGKEWKIFRMEWIMKKIVAINNVASRPPPSDQLQYCHFCQKLHHRNNNVKFKRSNMGIGNIQILLKGEGVPPLCLKLCSFT